MHRLARPNSSTTRRRYIHPAIRAKYNVATPNIKKSIRISLIYNNTLKNSPTNHTRQIFNHQKKTPKKIPPSTQHIQNPSQKKKQKRTSTLVLLIIPIPNPQPNRTILNIPLPLPLPLGINLQITIRRPIPRQIPPHIPLPIELARPQLLPQNFQHILADKIQENKIDIILKLAI